MSIDRLIRELENLTIYSDTFCNCVCSPIAYERLARVADHLERHAYEVMCNPGANIRARKVARCLENRANEIKLKIFRENLRRGDKE